MVAVSGSGLTATGRTLLRPAARRGELRNASRCPRARAPNSIRAIRVVALRAAKVETIRACAHRFHWAFEVFRDWR